MICFISNICISKTSPLRHLQALASVSSPGLPLIESFAVDLVTGNEGKMRQTSFPSEWSRADKEHDSPRSDEAIGSRGVNGLLNGRVQASVCTQARSGPLHICLSGTHARTHSPFIQPKRSLIFSSPQRRDASNATTASSAATLGRRRLLRRAPICFSQSPSEEDEERWRDWSVRLWSSERRLSAILDWKPEH